MFYTTCLFYATKFYNLVINDTALYMASGYVHEPNLQIISVNKSIHHD